jgi:peptidoglycan LD-endopeptidase CwlK
MADIIDSALTKQAALQDAPDLPAPADIRRALEVIPVTYVGFDALIHRGQIVIHATLAADVQSFFDLALAIQFPITSVIPIADARFLWNDRISCDRNNTSGYNFRSITGNPKKLSAHAAGLAFDVNPLQNVYLKYDDQGQEACRIPAHGSYNPNAPGTLTELHPLVQHLKERDWTWGGDWNNPKDYQHFEKVL